MSRESLDAVAGAFDAFNRGDVPAMTAGMASDGKIVPLRWAIEDTIYTGGPEGMQRFWADITETWAEIRMEVEELRDLGDERVLAIGVLLGTARGSGVPVSSKMAWIVEVSAGRITYMRTYSDAAAALEAEGLQE